MSAQRVILVCGWCPTLIPSQDEVQHHFLVAHGQPVGQSVRYFYPDDVDSPHERARLQPRGAR